MMKFSRFCGTLALGLGFALPAVAQDPTATTVLATVNGVEITLGDLIVPTPGVGLGFEQPVVHPITRFHSCTITDSKSPALA